MTMTISSSALPAIHQMFDTLDSILAKAAERCKATEVDESVYLGWRMAPDMFPLATQVRFATEIPARGLSRLAGAELPSFPDDEKTIAELRERIVRARKIIEELDKGAVDADPDGDITVPAGQMELTMERAVFARNWIMPNVYFHTTTAYLILRHLGLDIGKRDFLAEMKGFLKS